MSPVCINCRATMCIDKTGADLEEMADETHPYRIWNADVFRCYGCGSRIAAQFADRPLAEHFQAKYRDFLGGIMSRFWPCIKDVPVEVKQ